MLRHIVQLAGMVLLAAAAAVPQARPPAPSNAPQTAVSSAARMRPPAPGYAFPNGEIFHYAVDWRLWNAGTATLRMDSVSGQERVIGTADAVGAVAVLYTVRDRFQSFFNPATFCSVQIEKHVEEGFRKRETHIRFDYARGKSVLDETNLKTNQVKHQENDIPGCVSDVLSGIFFVASQALEPGATIAFPLNDGGKSNTVLAHVEAREEVKTDAGTFKTIRVQPEAATGVLKDRGRVWIWYSDDTAHIPVQMRARMFWGTLTFRLQRIEKVK